eukprot:1142598-Pelagomonas_calceolata.AAC.2
MSQLDEVVVSGRTLNAKKEHIWAHAYRFIEWTVSHNIGLIGLVLVLSSTQRWKLKDEVTKGVLQPDCSVDRPVTGPRQPVDLEAQK